MTKRLFVVLVVLTALLISFTLVMAAKEQFRGTPDLYVKPTIAKQQANQMPRGHMTGTVTASSLYPNAQTRGTPTVTPVAQTGTIIQAAPFQHNKDFCDLYGTPYWSISSWLVGDEWYAEYQDPEEFGCVDVWPFQVTSVGFNLQVSAAQDVDVQGFVYDLDLTDPGCPVPGAQLCSTPEYTVSLPGAGHWIIELPMTDECCVNGPYFSVVYIATYPIYETLIADNNPVTCRSYNDYGFGWEDLVDVYGFPGQMLFWSTGYTSPQNDCGGGPTDQCELKYHNGSASGYFPGWGVGDQEAVYFDPAALCTGCTEVYPLSLTEVKANVYDYASQGTVDFIVHIYDAPDITLGPGIELGSFETTVTTFYPDEATITVPEQLCIQGPFYLAFEYNSGVVGSTPSLLTDNQSGAVPLNYQWNYYQTYGWIEWNDFWAAPIPGYVMVSATGTCNEALCNPGIECDLIQDPGVINSYFGSWAADDQVAKYFDPEVYCDPPVYPLRLSDVQTLLYNFAAVPSVDIRIAIYLECSNPCDGPGTKVYESDPITIDTFYPNMVNIPLPDLVCLYEPFFITIEYASGAQGSTPSPLWANSSYPCDTCHAWIWWQSGGYPFWIEWHDFWAPPAGGCPIIRGTAYTESPACDIPSCDTTLQTLWGGEFAYYYWKTPPNDEFLNMRFEMPGDHSGRLETMQFGFYGTGTTGTPDPDFYVWLSDGEFPLDNNPPYQAIAAFHIPFEDMLYWPAYTEVDAYPRNLVFDAGEMFHLGFCHAFEPGDTMAPLSDDGSTGQERSSGWTGTEWEDYYPYQFTFNAVICPFAPTNPTFTQKCRPTVGYATPGDPPVDVYTIELTSILGYSDNVTFSLLSVTPTANITAGFTPNGVPCPYTSTVDITVDAAVPYGDYTLTFQGMGGDGQTVTCNVTLTVQPPYDEGIVNFYHGYQRATNFGAVGNADHSAQNFVWYGVAPLFDGSIISLAPIEPYEDHMALDMYDCLHLGFIPTQHMTITDTPWCIGSPYEESYGEVAYSNFYTEEDVISCEYDSLFIIGLKDVECTDFSIKLKIYYNPTETPIPELYAGVFEDWDVGDDWAELDTLHNMIYQYDIADPSIVFGIMSVPFYDQFAYNMVSVYNVEEVYPTGTHSVNCGTLDGPQYLAQLMMEPGYRYPGFWGEGADDHSVLITSPPFALNPGDKHIEIWVDFGRNLADGLTWEQWYHKILRYLGFYRGDVNASDELELPALDVSDLVYLVNYLYKGGPAPIPFADQGDVDGRGPYGGPPDVTCPKNNVDVQDVVYLLNYIYKGGPPPVDRVRFIEQYWSRPSLFLNPVW
jgi:hypothetical protein